MDRLTYTYKYKNYPDCLEATRLSRFFCSPKHGGYIGMALALNLMLLGVLAYNANNHHLGVID